MAKRVINSFNAGELSPYLYARSDIDKYSSGCLTMENFIPLPYGGVTRRPAIEYEFVSVDNDKVRLIPFVPTVDNAFLLVIGDEQINIYQDGVLKELIETAEGNGTVPWGEDELDDLKYIQSIDVMWLVHPDHPVQRLSRVSDTSWTIAAETFDFPPLKEENDDEIYFDLTFTETAWESNHAYVIGDVIEFDAVVYKCIADHTSDATVAPGPYFSIDYNNGWWVASNTGSTALLKSYDAVTGGNPVDQFTEDDVGEYYVIENTRNIAWFQHANAAAPTPTNPPSIDNGSNEIKSKIGTSASASLISDFVTGAINVSFSDWEATLSTNSFGRFSIERSIDNGVTWEDYVYIATEPVAGTYSWAVSSDSPEGGNTWLRMKATDFGTGGAVTFAPEIVVPNMTGMKGIVKITGYTSATQVTVEVISNVQQELSAGIAGTITDYVGGVAFIATRSKKWSKGAFSAASGYPNSIALFENRLTYAGTTTEPNTVWMSVIDDYQNFLMGSLADDAMKLTLNSGQFDEIRWMVPQEKLVIGTAGNEWSLGASDERKAITPTGYDLKQRTNRGSNHLQAIPVDSSILFMMRQSRKLREWTPNYNVSNFEVPDLSILAEHITSGGVTQWAYQQQPDNVLWSIRGDGTLLGFTYERDQNVTGWHRHTVTNAAAADDQPDFESIAVLPRDNEEDELWVSVRMTVDSTEKRYIGRLNDREWGTNYLTEWQGLDMYQSYTKPGAAWATTTSYVVGDLVKYLVDSKYYKCLVAHDSGTFATDLGAGKWGLTTGSGTALDLTGLGYLEGESVSWVADGVVKTNKTVTGGLILIDAATYTTVVVGLAFTSTLAPLYVNADNQYGTSQGSKTDLRKATIRFKDTFSAQVGPAVDDLEDVVFNSEDTALYSEDAETWFNNSSEFLQTTYIVQEDPMPCTVLAMIPNQEVRR